MPFVTLLRLVSAALLDWIRPVDVPATCDRQHYVRRSCHTPACKRWLNTGTLYPIYLELRTEKPACFFFRSAVRRTARRDALVSPALIDRDDAE